MAAAWFDPAHAGDIARIVPRSLRAADCAPPRFFKTSGPVSAGFCLPRLIAFTGKAGAGKTTAAQALVERFGYVRIGFADPLKAMLAAFLDQVGVHPETVHSMLHGDLKNAPAGYLAGHSARHAMQTLGTEWGRRCMRGDFWIEAMRQRVGRSPAQKFVIDDLRFDNEAEFVRVNRGLVFEVRDGTSPSAQAHESERGIARDLVDGIIMNDRDEHFANQVCRAVRARGASQ